MIYAIFVNFGTETWAQNMRNAHDFLGRQLVIVGGKGLQMVDFISS